MTEEVISSGSFQQGENDLFFRKAGLSRPSSSFLAQCGKGRGCPAAPSAGFQNKRVFN
jgi:hypothetical protein